MQANKNLICDLQIADGTKGELILALLGKKPGVLIDLFKHNDDPATVISRLQDAGFSCVKTKIKGGERHVCQLAVALKKETAEKLAAACNAHDDYQIGMLLGYPQSAVIAYCTGGRLPQRDIPTSMRINPLAFTFSLVASRLEIRIVQLWTALVRKHLPEIGNAFPM